MFIKKDLRKIDEIFADEKDSRECIILSKRQAEFQNSIKAICKESKIKFLMNMRTLNLYDNAISNVQGIGLLSQTPLEELNLGSNKLSSLPLEVCNLNSPSNLQNFHSISISLAHW